MNADEFIPANLPNIAGRADIEQLVNAFSGKVCADELVGFIFNDVAKADWSAHLPNIDAFWEPMLFRTSGCVGNLPAVARAASAKDCRVRNPGMPCSFPLALTRWKFTACRCMGRDARQSRAQCGRKKVPAPLLVTVTDCEGDAAVGKLVDFVDVDGQAAAEQGPR